MAKGNAVVIDIFVNAAKGVKDASAALLKVGNDATKSIGGAMGAAVNSIAVANIAAVAVGLTAGSKAAMDFEDAFAKVRKTMSHIKDPVVFEKIANDLQRLSTQIPLRSVELAGLAAVAGQLGVEAKNVSSFTEVIGKLSVATNMTGQQAATSLARFLNVTNESTESANKFASVMVELGNNVAAQESEIIQLAQNFGATGTVAGLSAEDILAYSAATRESGVAAAAGATALGKMFMNISNAVKEGNVSKLQTLSELIGRDFATAFREDGAMAVQEMLEGISRLSQQGKSVTPVLNELGLSNVRTSRAVLSLANNNEGLAKSIELARGEAQRQSALNQEANIRFDTLAMKVNQLKAAFKTLLEKWGERFLGFWKSVVDVLLGVTRALNGMLDAFDGLAQGIKTGITIAINILTLVALKGFIHGAKAAAGASGQAGRAKAFWTAATQKLTFSLRGMLATMGPIIIAMTAFVALGKRMAKQTDFDSAVKNITGRLEELQEFGADFAEGFNEEVMKGIAEGLPESIQKGIESAMKTGVLREEVAEEAVAIARDVSDTLVEILEDTINVDGVDFGGTLLGMQKIINELTATGMTEEAAELVKLAKEYQKQAALGGKGSKEIKEQIFGAMTFYTTMLVAQRESRDLYGELVDLVELEFGLQVARSTWFEGMVENEEKMLEFAKERLSHLPKIKKILEEMGIIDPFEAADSAMSELQKKARKLQDAVEKIFEPINLQFNVEFAELDLLEAREERQELIEEEVELQEELVELAQEQSDLEASALMTKEELVEQQDLINEALKIEERLRKGLALSANDQLRREKLRKDRRRVELAMSQGSIEFADLELEAIDENIAAIEERIVTQSDADDLRAKALEIEHNAQIRRSEEIERIEERRIEINERLTELPREMRRALKEVYDAQKDLITANVELFTSFEDLGHVSIEQAKKMASALGLPLSVISEIQKIGQTGISSANWLNKFLPDGFGIHHTNEDNSFSSNPNYKRFKEVEGFKAIGGAVKPSANYVVGEKGPELLKMFPHGGGYVSKLGNMDSGVTQSNNVNLNITGLPTDPISARKIAQNIQRELNKLASDGRSSVVR